MIGNSVRRHVLGDTPNDDAPSRTGDVLDHHEEQRTERDAQREHVGDQVGEPEAAVRITGEDEARDQRDRAGAEQLGRRGEVAFLDAS